MRDRQRHEWRNVLVSHLPDLLHLGGGATATLLAAARAPVYMSWILAIGILSTGAT